MARTWLSLTVELLGGQGEELWPRPGRVFAVAPSHTFSELAEAVNLAFARWDPAHLSAFTLADGRVVTGHETGTELASSASGPMLAPLDMDETTLGSAVRLRDEFRFTFDFGDDWVHRCVVGDEHVDPFEVLGIGRGSRCRTVDGAVSPTSTGAGGQTTMAIAECPAVRGRRIRCSSTRAPSVGSGDSCTKSSWPVDGTASPPTGSGGVRGSCSPHGVSA